MTEQALEKLDTHADGKIDLPELLQGMKDVVGNPEQKIALIDELKTKKGALAQSAERALMTAFAHTKKNIIDRYNTSPDGRKNYLLTEEQAILSLIATLYTQGSSDDIVNGLLNEQKQNKRKDAMTQRDTNGLVAKIHQNISLVQNAFAQFEQERQEISEQKHGARDIVGMAGDFVTGGGLQELGTGNTIYRGMLNRAKSDMGQVYSAQKQEIQKLLRQIPDGDTKRQLEENLELMRTQYIELKSKKLEDQSFGEVLSATQNNLGEYGKYAVAGAKGVAEGVWDGAKFVGEIVGIGAAALLNSDARNLFVSEISEIISKMNVENTKALYDNRKLIMEGIEQELNKISKLPSEEQAEAIGKLAGAVAGTFLATGGIVKAGKSVAEGSSWLAGKVAGKTTQIVGKLSGSGGVHGKQIAKEGGELVTRTIDDISKIASGKSKTFWNGKNYYVFTKGPDGETFLSHSNVDQKQLGANLYGIPLSISYANGKLLMHTIAETEDSAVFIHHIENISSVEDGIGSNVDTFVAVELKTRAKGAVDRAVNGIKAGDTIQIPKGDAGDTRIIRVENILPNPDGRVIITWDEGGKKLKKTIDPKSIKKLEK